jgi:hypothetical protein
MIFTIGLTVGLVISIMVFTILAFFRVGIERQVRIIETRLENAGPKPRGAIILPPNEDDEFRQDFVNKRASKGQRTTLSDLRDND